MTDNAQDVTTPTELKDTIEQEVTIEAPVEAVWHLVSVPGWWIVDCAEDDMRRIREADGPSVVLQDAFKIDTIDLTSPRTASFRWTWTQDDDRPTTIVSFDLDETSNGTRVRVKESGLSVGGPAQLLATHYSENRDGWQEQLTLLRNHAQAKR
jgi:uncharacterized protein YndB with AHSA1/START domain